MAKTEVYSWRLSAGLKAQLERAARREGRSVAELLDDLVARGLEGLPVDRDDQDEAERRRIWKAMEPFIGCLDGDDPTRSERVSEIVREKVRQKHGRSRSR